MLTERSNLTGKELTTIKVGGKLESVFTLEDQSNVTELFSKINQFKIIGAGSNTVIGDNGLTIPVIRLGRGFRFVESLGSGRFRIGAAVALMNLARDLSKDGFSGLEFAAGIPAQLGGACFMNAGAHSGEFSQIIESISGYNKTAQLVKISARELDFQYRHSGIPEDFLITEAVVKLSVGSSQKSLKLMTDYLNERKARQPLTLPSCGSVFRNPTDPKLGSAGALIEKVGMKGAKIGGISVSSLHANWLVNSEKNGTAADFIDLMNLIYKTVDQKLGIKLIREVKVWE